ncbi:MAG TPA: FtsX-like permease family protein [Candidatus Aerophobetes bacterium]|uniref:FtsX-like permease family protein n=1 Tax=Aerophobetes bacterium TaxID=2030807 RepID=A0A7V5LZH2_UNCAE|nr:FtsX-like permease family protein [Candidatus Aerophobetes bacterium]
MDIRETFRSALDGLSANKMRSLLSILGIVIGIAAVVAIVAITQGSQKRVLENIRSLGTNLITVAPGTIRGAAGRVARERTNIFTTEDGELILKKARAVAQVVPVVRRNLLLKYKDKNTQITVYGVTPPYEDVLNFHVQNGRFITERDLDTFSTVIVIGKQVAEDLFGNENPLGKDIIVNPPGKPLQKHKFKVVGVMQPKGQVMFLNFDNQAFIPLTTAQKRILNTNYVNSFYIQAKDEKSMDEALAQIDAILYLKFQDDSKYTVLSQEEILSTMQNITGTFTIMLAGIAAVSLLVGGIGIMNIMLVSVTERTREIGIRMAVGARRIDILFQFLWESVLLCLIGGAIGIATGVFGSKLITSIGVRIIPMGPASAPSEIVISPQTILLAFGFATAIGLFFGVYPASKASKMDPVQALMYE